ncbi:HAD family hydrolase [Catenulispora yoronensis]
MPLHLVWDWNGTVLNDFEIILRSTNDSFGDHGLAPITAEQYRTQIKMPIRSFYADILGHEPTDEEWEGLDSTFHKYYVAYERQARLSDGLPDLFRDWAGRATRSRCCRCTTTTSWCRWSATTASRTTSRWSRARPRPGRPARPSTWPTTCGGCGWSPPGWC